MENTDKSGLKYSSLLCFRWNKLLFISLFLSVGTLIISCKKDQKDQKDQKESSYYYVKYEVNSSTIYYGGKLNVEIKNESNITKVYNINQRELWEVIVGPVDSTFTAKLKVMAIGETYGKLKLFPSIYVSKDNGPFTLENTDGSENFRNEVEISYRIK